MADSVEHNIVFQPLGIRAAVGEQQTVLDAAQAAGIDLAAVCGGNGQCGKCGVDVRSGQVAGDAVDEEHPNRYLSCRIKPLSDLVVVVPESTLNAKQRLQVECEALRIEDDDAGWTLIPGADNVGIAVDVGSTKVAAYLVDLERREIIGTSAGVNRQMIFGEDIISRIAHYSNGSEEAKAVQVALRESVNAVLTRLLADSNVPADFVRAVVMVGNTVMHHFLCGLPVDSLGQSPYQPVELSAVRRRSEELGLCIEGHVPVYLPPNIAGYVGGDHVAALLSSGLLTCDETVMLCDIGTNTEISLMHEGMIRSCSCASGPAFEGAHISQGMKAVRGAISHVSIVDGQITVSTVEDAPSCGICGSGVLDAVAELIRSGALLSSGQLKREHPLVKERGEGAFVQLDDNVVVTQQDISVLQLAKGAIRAGIEVLLNEENLDANQIERFYLAGAFGTYVHIESVLQAGLVCPLSSQVVRQIGNAAGLGAVMLLLSERLRNELDHIAGRIVHVPLTDTDGFNRILARAMMFPKLL